MKVLVTVGAGYIGSIITEELQNEGTTRTVKQVVDTAREVTGHEIPTRLGPRHTGDPAEPIASSEKIKRDLG